MAKIVFTVASPTVFSFPRLITFSCAVFAVISSVASKTCSSGWNYIENSFVYSLDLCGNNERPKVDLFKNALSFMFDGALNTTPHKKYSFPLRISLYYLQHKDNDYWWVKSWISKKLSDWQDNIFYKIINLSNFSEELRKHI